MQIFAAAPLAPPLKEIVALYAKRSPQKIRLNFASSAVLAQQMERTGPADIIIFEGDAEMIRLEGSGGIEPGSRSELLLNSLVVVGRHDSTQVVKKLSDLAEPLVPRILIPDPQKSQGGRHAQELLTKLPDSEKIIAKITLAKNVKQTFKALKTNPVDVAVVLKTQAAAEKEIKILFAVPISEGPRLTFAVAIPKDAKHRAAAEQFLQFLKTKEAAIIFDRAGFSPAKN